MNIGVFINGKLTYHNTVTADILNNIILNYRSFSTIMKVYTCSTHIFNCAVFKGEVFSVSYIDSSCRSEYTKLICLEDAEISIHTSLNINQTFFTGHCPVAVTEGDTLKGKILNLVATCCAYCDKVFNYGYNNL